MKKKPTKKIVRQALKDSIAHWQRMIDKGRGRPFSEDCPLCGLFSFFENDTVEFGDCCHGCPVMARTGLDGCNGTPYKDAYIAWDRLGAGSKEFKAAAKKEVEFLKSLLPQPPKRKNK